MKLHPNAKTTPASRALLIDRVIEEGWLVVEAANALGISVRAAHKRLARFRKEGLGGLRDRSSAPSRRPLATPTRVIRRIERLRRRRLVA